VVKDLGNKQEILDFKLGFGGPILVCDRVFREVFGSSVALWVVVSA
jgi:hypothetical protein